APETARNWGSQLVFDDVSEVREVGMRVLARFPSIQPLDQLWNLHIESVRICEKKEEHEHWWVPYDISFAALRACVRANPAWLEDRIRRADKDREPVSELAYLLANLESDSGQTIWQASKAILFEKVPQNKLRSLARCIWRFKDRDEVLRLEK